MIFFFVTYSFFSFSYCSIDLKNQLEKSGPRSDTSSFVSVSFANWNGETKIELSKTSTFFLFYQYFDQKNT